MRKAKGSFGLPETDLHHTGGENSSRNKREQERDEIRMSKRRDEHIELIFNKWVEGVCE